MVKQDLLIPPPIFSHQCNSLLFLYQKIDVMGRLVDDLINKTHEFLQPNPASRAKMQTANTINKLRGQSKVNMYPQPEGTLGEHMIKHGRDLGDDNVFGKYL